MEASPQLVKACFSRVVWVPPHYKLHSEDRSDGGMVMQIFPMCHILVPRPVKWVKKETHRIAGVKNKAVPPALLSWLSCLYFPCFSFALFVLRPEQQQHKSSILPCKPLCLLSFSPRLWRIRLTWISADMSIQLPCFPWLRCLWKFMSGWCPTDCVIHVPTLPLTAALHFLLKFSFISVIQPLNTNFNLFQENKFSSAQDDVAIGWSVSILGRDIDYFF